MHFFDFVLEGFDLYLLSSKAKQSLIRTSYFLNFISLFYYYSYVKESLRVVEKLGYGQSYFPLQLTYFYLTLEQALESTTV